MTVAASDAEPVTAAMTLIGYPQIVAKMLTSFVNLDDTPLDTFDGRRRL
jgi:hypothetical protein